MRAAAPGAVASPIGLGPLVIERAADHLAVETELLVDPHHPYLRAHFPGRAVFPGVFHLELLERAVRTAAPEAGELLEIRSVRLSAAATAGSVVRLRARIPDAAPGAPREVEARVHRTSGDVLVARLRVVFGAQAGS